MNKLCKLVTIIFIIVTISGVSAILPNYNAHAGAGPPTVVCVPASALNPVVPHDTWSGLEITLKCTAHDPDGDNTLNTYTWDFGDGSPSEAGTVADPYAIEARHTYIGNIGDLFVATLTVTDVDGEVGSDHYLVEIKDGAELAVQVNVAIDEGLWRLHKDQYRDTLPDGTPYGYWPYGGYEVAATGASTEAFEIQGSLPSGDFGIDPYVETVQRGLNYLLSQMNSFPIAQDVTYCPLGNPDVNGNGIGLNAYSTHEVYENGIALMALSSSRCPSCIAATGSPDVAGRTYLDISQDMVDGIAYCQTDPSAGNYRGGWRYSCNFGHSDNSVSQWPVIGLESAEVNFGSYGLTVPQFVKDELSLWIDYIQNDVDGDWADGGSGYSDPWDWVNVAKTGGLLAEMKFVGDTTASSRVQDAVAFIDQYWETDGEHFLSNSYYAFYSVMKGFRLLGIQTIDPINDPSGFDWYNDLPWGYAQHIVNDQAPDGAWPGWSWSGHPLRSAWAVLTLKKTVVQPGPVADAGPDVPKHPPIIEITFDGTGSYHRDASRNIAQYIWDFGDGSPPVEGPVVTHAFPAFYNLDGTIDWVATAQDYIVTLTVVDDSTPPLTDSDTAVVRIDAPPWPPVADANGPYTLYPCWPATLDGSGSYDPNGALYPDPSHPWYGEIVSWEWDLDNDGEYDDATGETVSWSSCDLGIHVVGLKVTNSFDESDEVDTVVNVIELPSLPPVADANGPYLGPIEPEIIYFDGGGSFDPEGYPLTYDWNWGDGNTSEDAGANPSHSYAEANIYDVCLTVTDPDGLSDTACTTAVVFDPEGGFVTGGGWIDSPAGAYYPSDLPFYEGSFYEIVILEQPLTFAEAREAAEAMTYRTCESAHLATITSQGEYDAVLELFDAWHSADLGGYQDEDELVANQGWEWVTGEPFDFEVQLDWWLPGEPNDCGDETCKPGSEQILQMYPDGWNDVNRYDAISMWNPMVEYENCDLGPTGKATFGFVSKYKKGAKIPTGNTEFQFHAGDLNFHSSSYDWLVVTGSNYAKFKGTGTINGEGEYKFQIWAGDDDPDTFRIKIWTEDEFDVETVVYDNGMDQEIGGGSIVIHTKN